MYLFLCGSADRWNWYKLFSFSKIFYTLIASPLSDFRHSRTKRNQDNEANRNFLIHLNQYSFICKYDIFICCSFSQPFSNKFPPFSHARCHALLISDPDKSCHFSSFSLSIYSQNEGFFSLCRCFSQHCQLCSRKNTNGCELWTLRSAQMYWRETWCVSLWRL